MEKRCFKCGEAKPVDAFYAHPRMADGRLNKCKNCTCSDARQHRVKHPEKHREREARYRRNRYARDPEFRLLIVNRNRTRAGLRPYAAVDEIGSVRAERQRDRQGRFI